MQEKSCGGIIYRKHHGNIELMLIKHLKGGFWSFPKGHMEEGETEVETARREILEETGIEVMIDSSFRETVNYSPKKGVNKDVVYFLATALSYDIKPQDSEISQIKWVELSRVDDVLTYDNDKQMAKRVKPHIIKR
ncbi:MAG: NUDIX domain-containing protein [Oscillospiraceae bacterium]|nr:NUDIX domain-containing protein [Oscillospiraceae bacterium]